MLADDAAREAIRTRLDVTMMVEAAAGTGKTSSLVSRAVALLRSGRATVATLAAITFTVKAAAQLRERIQEKLEAEAREAEGVERERLEAAVRDLDRAVIGTTHAFCARLLRERPVEAGLDPEFEELDDVAARLVTAEFWQRWYDTRAAVGDPTLVRAREVGLKPDLLRTTFERLVDHHGDVEIVATECDKPDLAHAVATVREMLGEIANDLPGPQHREKADAFEEMVRDLLRLERSLDLDDVSDQLKFLDRANHKSTKPIQKNWPDKPRAKRYGETWSASVLATVRPTVRRWREYVHCIALNVLRPALDDFARERVANATLTFGDLLVRSRDLLRDHPNVRRYFQQRFTHVLVDEFQDTDPVQAEVLMFLTGTEVEERNWRRLAPRPGSLFIVGDPKQSIYRFRRADISTYLEVKQRIQETGGSVEALSTNFRSVAPICRFVNTAFESLFDRAEVEAKRQAPHHELTPFHEGQDAVIRNGVYNLESPDGRNDEISEAEAPCVAEWIRDAVANGQQIAAHDGARAVRFGDFMLVSRDRRHLTLYARELERCGIPYRITGGDGLARSQPLRALLPLLRAVCDPDNAVEVVAFLRGPLCGASDQDLFDYAQLRGKWSPFAPMPDGAPSAVRDGLRTLRDAIDATRELPPAAALARIFELVALSPAAATLDQPGTAAGNTLLALAIARQESAAGASFASIVERLDEIVESDLKLEEMDVDPARADAVQLMNLHQVKGLEAPIVFLIDPFRPFKKEPAQHIDRSGEASRGHFAIRTDRRGRKGPQDVALPKDWEQLSAIEERYATAEEKRLLYVAATRAMHVLVIGVTKKDGKPQGVWAELAQFVSGSLFEAGGSRSTAKAASSRSEDPSAAIARLAAQRADALRSTYSVLPITKIAHADHSQLVKDEEGLGRGTSWGRVMHRLLEALVRDPSIDVRLYAANLLKDEERDAAELEEVVATIDAVRSSSLWQRILAAEERLVEVPFAVSVNARELGVDFDGDTLLHGTVDLAFRERGMWWIIDYKSDRTSGRLRMLVDYYRPQVEHYVRFWQQLTGEETRGGLFFVDGSQLVEL